MLRDVVVVVLDDLVELLTYSNDIDVLLSPVLCDNFLLAYYWCTKMTVMQPLQFVQKTKLDAMMGG